VLILTAITTSLKALPKEELSRHWWLTPVILATQEAEIRETQFKASPGKYFCETLSQKNPSQK
jgi:hypothetical protein